METKTDAVVKMAAFEVVEKLHELKVAEELDKVSTVIYEVGRRLVIIPKAFVKPELVEALKSLGFRWRYHVPEYFGVGHLSVEVDDRDIVKPNPRRIRVELDRWCGEEIMEMLYEGERERQREEGLL